MYAHGCVEVMVATAHEMLTEALRMALSTFDKLVLVGEANTEQELFNLCTEHPSGILLLDWLLPQRDKRATLDDIRYYCPEIQIIVLANNMDDLLIDRAERGEVRFFYQETLTLADLESAFQVFYN